MKTFKFKCNDIIVTTSLINDISNDSHDLKWGFISSDVIGIQIGKNSCQYSINEMHVDYASSPPVITTGEEYYLFSSRII